MLKMPLPIGIEFYKDMKNKPYFYVDKTLLIKDLLDKGGKVNLFTRLRRFGKTLALSMIRTFFEQEIGQDGIVIDNHHYFRGTKIEQAGQTYIDHMGQYPVISLSLKSAKQPDFTMAYESLVDEMIKEYNRHHQKNVIILLDEYDVPLENSYFRGFYDEMIDFIRSLFESALKTNDVLEFAVVTGCLRISRESIFTRLNNLKMVSILDESFAEFFGFTPEEMQKTLDDNSIVRELVDGADDSVKTEIEQLIAGGSVEKPVHEEITYGEMHKSQDNLWNFLFFTGYLKAVSRRFASDTIYLTLTLPNDEIRYIYRNTIREWFEERKEDYNPTAFYEGMRTGDCEKIEEFINHQLSGSISYFDSAENFYHGYLLGILGGIGGYQIYSNREQGNGRPDLALEPHNPRVAAIIIEIKHVQKFSQMEAGCEQALQQMEEKNYAAKLLDEGYKTIFQYGFCFCKKSCMVKFSELQ